MVRGALPPTYFINLDRSEGRRTRMLARLAERGLEATRVPAFDGRDEARTRARIRSRAKSSLDAACIASHLHAIELAYQAGHDEALVLEDDVTFEPYDAWPGGYACIRRELPERYGALALCIAELPKHLDALFVKPGLVHPLKRRAYWSAGAYVISRIGMEALLSRYARGGVYDVTGFMGHQHAYEVLMRTLQLPSAPPPYLSRIPLFLFEGDDSEIHPDHLGEHRLARDYLRASYLDLVRGSYRSPFTLRARLESVWRALA